MKKYLIAFILFTAVANGFCQNFILPLWEKEIPNFQKTDEVEFRDTSDVVRISYVQTPEIEVYLPTKKGATGQAVVICPGGGYVRLAYDWEGSDIAKLFNSRGIAAIVLKYRLPISKSNIVPHETPLIDVKRAMRLTRYHAASWNIDSNKIGVIGFSAGGHLASTLGTHFDFVLSFASDPVETMSSRPDFMILIYPVISMTQSFMHKGSRNALLGESSDPELARYYSNELQVKKDTPPTFLIHSTDDKSVPVENSLVFYKALIEQNVPVEMHIYPEGGHGFSLATGKGHWQFWTERCFDWLDWLEKN